MGWSGKKNGELLSIAAGEQFEVLVTIDQGNGVSAESRDP